MTEQEFKSRKFGHSQNLDYLHPRFKVRISAILMAVDFDNDNIQLWVHEQDIDEDRHIPEQEIWTTYEHVFLPKIKLKKV